EDCTDDDPDDTSCCRESDGLKKELLENIATGSAKRLPKTDLLCTFGHRHKHDIHNADTAHNQGDGHYGCEEGGKNADDERDLFDKSSLRLHIEIILLPRINVMRIPERHFNVVHHAVHRFGTFGAEEDRIIRI